MAKRVIKKKDIKGELTAPSEIEKATAELTNQPSSPTEPEAEKKKVQVGRPPHPQKKFRRKYTTMMDKALISEIKILAIKKDMTTADLLEKMIIEYLAKTRK